MKQTLQQFSGAIGVLLLWLIVPILMLKARLGLLDIRPISYLGIEHSTMRIFNITLIVSAVLFISFSRFVARRFKLSGKFLMVFYIGQLGQIITALTPYGHQQPERAIHTIAAFTLAFSLPLVIRMFTKNQSGSSHRYLYGRLYQLEKLAFVVGIGLFVFTKGIAPLAEALPAFGFHIWIIALTFVTYFEPANTQITLK